MVELVPYHMILAAKGGDSIAMEAIIEPISLYEPVFSDNGDSIYVLDQLSDNTTLLFQR